MPEALTMRTSAPLAAVRFTPPNWQFDARHGTGLVGDLALDEEALDVLRLFATGVEHDAQAHFRLIVQVKGEFAILGQRIGQGLRTEVFLVGQARAFGHNDV